ncbi:MAG TPA: hypothetical protein VD999_01935 [Vitreimonas sp.]|nr:hypothetical protein [Vitreimonas sp.]
MTIELKEKLLAAYLASRANNKCIRVDQLEEIIKAPNLQEPLEKTHPEDFYLYCINWVNLLSENKITLKAEDRVNIEALAQVIRNPASAPQEN